MSKHDKTRMEQIYNMKQSGKTYREIAMSLGISTSRVSKLCKAWEQELLLRETNKDWKRATQTQVK